MTSASSLSVETAAEPQLQARLASIDIFRGLTMTLMIFVNQMADVKGLPWWNYHMKASVDAMTYVDMVFPFFLFIVGLSMPIAIESRLRGNPSMPALWRHVGMRTASLLVLGLILANAGAGDSARMGIGASLWAVVALTGAALWLNDYSPASFPPIVRRWLPVAGFAIVAVMLAIFRSIPAPGSSGWLDFSYPEILGLIGWSYLGVALVYIPLRKWNWAPLALFLAMMSLCVLTAGDWVTFTDELPFIAWPWGNGSMAGIMLAGIITSMIFTGSHRWPSLRQRMLLALIFAIAAIGAAWALTPLGVSKIRETPTWTLYSIGAAVLAFTALYWVCDVRGRTGWASFARPAGSNTLTTYLLPDYAHFLLAAAGIRYLDTHLDSHWPGVLKCAIFTALVLAAGSALTRSKIRLRL